MIQFRIKQQKINSDINYNIPKKVTYINQWNEKHVTDIEHIKGYDQSKLIFTKFRKTDTITPKSFEYRNEKIIIRITINNNTIKR